MAAIFISHSSEDTSQATKIASALEARGFQHLFLDFDPIHGIPGGSLWERELYRQLRQCQAVIVLCSPSSMQSDWVFAEITHARAQGKPVIPLEIIPCTPRSILSDTQIIKAGSLAEEGLDRLWAALESAGLDPARLEQWQGTRAPYPGLAPFDETDAAVFFGRDADVREGLDILNQLRRFGGARLALFLGPSGSGKSSLVRAGILPKLRRSPDWLVMPPMRPGHRPLDSLASTLSRVYGELGQQHAPDQIRDSLNDRTADGPLHRLAEDLLHRADRPDATLVLVIDQLEELLDPDQTAEAAALLDLLLPELTQAETRLLLIATMRSDFLAEFQHHPLLQTVAYRDIPVRCLGIRDFAQVISEPARIAGIELEEGLVDLILQDTETEQALPLLAYTLRALWEQYGQDGRLTKTDYLDGLGGLNGSIRRAADNLLADSDPSPETLSALRDAFRRLVRLNEDGQYARRSRRWEELPTASHEMLQRFVDHRLLVSGGEGNTLEVAHEALFRVWPKLRAWLDEDREFLLWRRRLLGRAEEWRSTGTPLRDAPLTEAERWLLERPTDLDDEEKAFITQSIQLRDRDARRERRRRRLTVGGLIAGLLVVSVLLGVAVDQYRQATESEAATRAQLAKTHWLNGVRSRDDQGEFVKATHHFARSAELLGEQPSGPTARMAVDFLSRGIGLERILQPEPRLQGMAASDDLRHIATWSGDDRIAVWSDDSNAPRLLPHANVSGAAFFADNQLMSWSSDGSVWIWDLASGTRLRQLPHDEGLRGAQIDKVSHRVLTWDTTGVVRLWDRDGSRPLARYAHQARVNRARLGDDGKGVVSWSNDRTVRRLSLGDPPRVETWTHPDVVLHAETAADGDDILSVAGDGNVRLWTSGRDEPLLTLGSGTGVPLDGALFVGSPSHILTWDLEGNLRLWRRDGSEAFAPFSHGGALRRVLIHAASARIATCGNDGRVILWDTEGRPLRELRHNGPVRGAQFSEDGTRLLTWSDDQRARLWDTRSGQLQGLPMVHGQSVREAIFDDRETRILTWSKGESVRIWQVDSRGSAGATVQHPAPIVEIAGDTTSGRLMSLASTGSVLSWPAGMPGDPVAVTLQNPTNATLQGGVIFTGRQRLAGWDREGITVWRLPQGDMQTRLPLGPAATGLVGVAANPEGHHLLAWGEDGYAQVVDGTTGTVLVSVPHGQPVIHGAIGADGTRALTAGAGFQVHTWHTDRPEPVVTLKVPGVHALGLSSDNRLAFAAGIDGWVQLWDPETGVQKRPVRHGTQVSGAVFGPDGTSLASWDQEGTIRLWNPSDGTERVPAFQHGPDLTAVAFSPDGKQLISWSPEAARVWNTADGYALTPGLQHEEPIRGARLIPVPEQPIAAIWGTSVVRTWRLPPLGGTETRNMALRQEIRTGTRLTEGGEVQVLDAVQWQGRKQRPDSGS